MNQRNPAFQWDSYFDALRGKPVRALLLDYDGTLAPFRIERDQATLNPVLRNALADILAARRSRVVIISGRALGDLIPLLGLDPTPELWGCHGWERRMQTGEYLGPDLEPEARAALDEARRRIRSLALEGCCEEKPTGVAVHWRGVAAPAAAQLREQVAAAWEPLARTDTLVLQEFDGGVELRVRGRDKGHAVEQILREMPGDAAVAYAGDDRTDEDAFRALSRRGLSIFVGAEYRPTAADVWLQPAGFARFLRMWATVDEEGECS